MVDGGANGGLLSSDALVLECDLIATADVVGVTNDVLPDLPLVQAAAKIETVDDGPIIGIFSLYAKRNNNGRTIHSEGQLESYGLVVDDKSRTAGGTQCIITNEGYVVPLHICQGLPYLDMSVPSSDDLDSLPHVFFCADTPWDPAVLDYEFNPASFDAPKQQVAIKRTPSQGSLPRHACSVALILNLETALASQQYHVRFYKLAETGKSLKRIWWKWQHNCHFHANSAPRN